MNTALSKDRLDMLNSILDKELDHLAYEDNLDNNTFDKENFDSMKFRSLTSKDFTSSSSLQFERNYETNLKEPRDITNQTNFKKSKNESTEPIQNLRMQDDLLELQSKIVNLEKKLGSLNNSTLSTKQMEYSSNSKHKINNQREHTRNYNERQTKEDLNDSLEYSPLQGKYTTRSPLKSSNRNLGDTLKDSSVFRNDSSSLSHSNSPIQRKTNKKERRSISQKSGKKSQIIKDVLERSIKEAQSQLDLSKASIKRRSVSRGRSNSINGKSPSVQKRNAGDSPIDKGSYQEIIILNKKMMELKKKRDEEKLLLQTEKFKNQEMIVQIEKMNSKMKKMQVDLEKFAKIDFDYNKLMESFEKSEYIRNQQKQLIANLQQEIEELKKGNNFESSENDEIKKKKNMSKSKTKKKL